MKSFLVVDDNRSMLKLYGFLLKSRFHKVAVHTATNGLEAMESAKGGGHDVILSDVEMVQMDGIDLYRNLKNQNPRQASRLAFISALDSPHVERFAREERIPFLAKPFSTPKFYHFVDEMIERSKREFIEPLGRLCGRRHPRTTVEKSCRLTPTEGKAAEIEGKTVDYSKAGVAITHEGNALLKGEVARIDIEGLEVFGREARVVWSVMTGRLARTGLSWVDAASSS